MKTGYKPIVEFLTVRVNACSHHCWVTARAWALYNKVI